MPALDLAEMAADRASLTQGLGAQMSGRDGSTPAWVAQSAGCWPPRGSTRKGSSLMSIPAAGPVAPASAAQKTADVSQDARAADGDYFTAGFGRATVKDDDGDYKSNSTQATTASAVQAALTDIKLRAADSPGGRRRAGLARASQYALSRDAEGARDCAAPGPLLEGKRIGRGVRTRHRANSNLSRPAYGVPSVCIVLRGNLPSVLNSLIRAAAIVCILIGGLRPATAARRIPFSSKS